MTSDARQVCANRGHKWHHVGLIRKCLRCSATHPENVARCGCCDSELVDGACPGRWIDNDGEECQSCA